MAGMAGDFAVTPEDAEEEMNATMASRTDNGARWPGMSYEQGVEAALAWVLGEREEKPLTEED